jgi:hypothetical protein
MDQMQTRLDALEQQMHTVNRRLRWWRGLACGLIGLAVLAWMLPAVIAQEDASTGGQRGLAPRVAALESLLKHVSREGNDITIKGANLHIVNGLGQTGCGSEEEPIPDCPNGLGNLIVGYNESREGEGLGPDIRTGSHNVVVGRLHNFSRFGGLVVGTTNTISGEFAAVSGGEFNTASGPFSAVSGGGSNTASGSNSSVSGGAVNTASGQTSVVSGGTDNTASNFAATVSGGFSNTASSDFSVVSGGSGNTAGGGAAVVCGGRGNEASGLFAAVGGGFSIIQETENGWAAGSEGDEGVMGNFHSP